MRVYILDLQVERDQASTMEIEDLTTAPLREDQVGEIRRQIRALGEASRTRHGLPRDSREYATALESETRLADALWHRLEHGDWSPAGAAGDDSSRPRFDPVTRSRPGA